jgi:PAS domain S-box-containing protein
MLKKQLTRLCNSMTLGTKFVVFIMVILSTTMSLNALYLYHGQKQAYLESLHAQAKVQAKLIASLSKEAILANDYLSLNRYMQDLAQLEDVIYGAIFSKSGDKMTSYLDKNHRYIKPLVDAGKPVTIEFIVDHFKNDEKVLVISAPIYLDEEPIGTLRMAMDKERLAEMARAELLKQLLSSITIILLLSTFIYFVFRFNVLKPIANLMAGAQRVANGNLAQDVITHGKDEFGTLTTSFNEMMHKLRESIGQNTAAMDKLQVLNSDLEQIVQERTARLELAQKIAHMGHWDYHVTTRQIHASNEIYNIFGIDPTKPLTRLRLIRFVYLDDRLKMIHAIRQCIRSGKPVDFELRIHRHDGELRTIAATAQLTTHDKSRYLFGIVQDITVRKAAETSAQRALVDKVNAESANRAKSAFLANMSHEIRTPLTAIIGYAETLLNTPVSPQEHAQSIGTILRNGKHLLHVINEILDLSKIESEKLAVENLPVNLTEICQDVSQVMSGQVQSKGLIFSFDYQFPLPTRINTDPVRLKQILFNLISNAIKFTSKGYIQISVRHVPERSLIGWTIVDTGIGIDEDKLKTLFSPFTQADSSTTRKFGGTGLGLYISRQLVQMLGGDISIKSIKGLGSRIDFTIATGRIDHADLITALPKPTQAAATTIAAPSQITAGRILLAEDSEDNQNLIKLLLKATDVQLSIVATGKAAIEAALAGDYDLVLMDMQMPEIDGVEATRYLRQAGYSRPIISLTANAMEEDRRRCLSAGASAFLTKPIDVNRFHDTLAQYLAAPAIQTSSPSENFIDEFEELRRDFILSLEARSARMLTALHDGNYVELAGCLHKLKGIAGAYGYPDLTAAAAHMESLHQCGKTSELHAELNQLIARIQQIVSHDLTHQPQRRESA